MATIAETAKSLNIPPNKLLKEIKRRFKDTNTTWTLDSELPDEFIEAAKVHAQEYAEASGATLPKGEITTSEGAILDNKVLLESLEYGILEAITEMREADIIDSAELGAIKEIQLYEFHHNKVWASYYQQKAQRAKQRRDKNHLDLFNQLTELNSQLGNRQGELIRQGEQFRLSLDESRDTTQTMLDALLK